MRLDVRDWTHALRQPLTFDPGVNVPLSEEEQRILEQIAADFHAQDPELAGELENTTLWRHARTQMKWAVIVFVLGLTVLVLALATAMSFVVSFAGFVVMLAAALWFERNTRKLGRAGWDHYHRSGGSQGLRDYLDARQEDLRNRLNRDDN